MLLFYSGFVHYFNGKSLLTILMHTQFDSSKCTLAEGFAKEVTIVNILQFFKFFEIAHVQWLFAILFLPIQVSFLSRCVWIVPISAAVSVHLLVVCWHRLLLIASHAVILSFTFSLLFGCWVSTVCAIAAGSLCAWISAPIINLPQGSALHGCEGVFLLELLRIVVASLALVRTVAERLPGSRFQLRWLASVAGAAGSRASLDFVSDGWVVWLIIDGPMFAISCIRTIIIVWAIVLAWWGTAHRVLTIIHKVIVLAADRLAVLLVGGVFLEARWPTMLLLMLKVHRIAIGSVVLPGAAVFVHVLALRDRAAVIIGSLNLRHSHCSRVVSRGHAAAVLVDAHWSIRFLRGCIGVLIPEGGGLWMRGDAIGCADARLHRVLTTHVMSLICEAAAIASCWQSVLINIGFCMQSFCFIIIAGAHRRVLITHCSRSLLSQELVRSKVV